MRNIGRLNREYLRTSLPCHCSYSRKRRLIVFDWPVSSSLEELIMAASVVQRFSAAEATNDRMRYTTLPSCE